jgi:hypothetical protein
MRSAATKDLKSVCEEFSTTAVQLASTRSELVAALPMLKSRENELSTANSDLVLTRSNLTEAVAEISSLKTSLEKMLHSYEKEKLEKGVAEKRPVTSKQGLAALQEKYVINQSLLLLTYASFDSYESLHSSFIALGNSHEASKASLSQAVTEAAEIKRSAADPLTSKAVSTGFSQC